MDTAEAQRVLASVEGAQRRVRETMWSTNWLLMLGGASLGVVAGLAVLLRFAADWVVWLDRGALVLLLVGWLATIRSRKRVGVDPYGSRWLFGRAVSVLVIVGFALMTVTALQDVGIVPLGFLPIITLAAPLGTALVAISLAMIAWQARIWIGGVLAVALLAAGVAAWILAPVQFTGLMIIAVSLSLAVLGVALRIQYPPRTPESEATSGD